MMVLLHAVNFKRAYLGRTVGHCRDLMTRWVFKVFMLQIKEVCNLFA